MKMDKEPVEETKVENESSDFEEACDITASSSLSSLEGERTGIDESDNDSGFMGVSQGSLDRLDTLTLGVTDKTNEGRLDSQGMSEKYDRAAILRELANGSIAAQVLMASKQMKKCGSETEMTTSACFENTNSDTDIPGEESDFEKLRELLAPIPDSLLHLLRGVQRPGDCARPSHQKPDWLDMDKLRRGQKFARDHMFSVCFAEMLSLFALFCFEDGLKPLIITGKSSTPYTAFKRYLSTGLRVRHWYTEDPWAKGTNAHKDIYTVRAMHAAVKRRLDTSTNAEIDAAAKIPDAWCPAQETLLKDFSETCRPPALGQCPYLVVRDSPHRPKGINQVDMAITQWGFVGLVVSFPTHLGVHNATDEDLEALCHLWRSIGYQLGIEDEYNFCRGTLKDIRQRSDDFLETWVKPNLRKITPEWEHMMRCVISGIGAFLPGLTFETAMLYLSELLDLKMPRLYASISYKDWINFNLSKSVFYYTIRLPGMTGLFNNLVNRAIDRAEKFTPEQLEAIRIKLATYSGNITTEQNRNIFNANF